MTSWRIAQITPVLGIAILLSACGSGASPSASVAPSAEPSAIESSTTSPAEATAAVSPTLTPEPSIAGSDYVVRKSDTLVSIAAKHHITLAALRAANLQVTNPRKLQIGQKLTIPSS